MWPAVFTLGRRKWTLASPFIESAFDPFGPDIFYKDTP